MNLVVVLVSLMLVMLAGAFMLVRSAGIQRRRSASTAFIDQQLQQRTTSNVAKMVAPPRRFESSGLPLWDRLLMRAGKKPTTGFYIGLFAPMLVLPLLSWLLLSGVAAFIVLIATIVLSYFRLWLAIDKRRRRMILQLPALLETMVRLITIGNSMGAAFQSAVGSVDMPLREVVDRVAAANRTGKELDAALAQAAQHYDLMELQLVAAVVSISLRFGGRSDQVLERMAGFMRDVEQARAELVALSAEVRISAWVLSLLPLGVAGFIVIFNTMLFVRMWEDPTGFRMLIGALILQIIGCWWLYRMAKSV
jgi:tight adherence protein B